MSDTTILPGGPQLPPSASGDGSTITQQPPGYPILSTDLGTNECVHLEGVFANANLPAGTPVNIKFVGGTPPNFGQFQQAAADVVFKSGVFGLLTKAAIEGGPCTTRDRGTLTLTEAEWDAVVQGESGGLVTGVFYYLNTNEGQKPIVPNQPDTDAQVLLGFAISPITMKININYLVTLVS